MSRNNQSNISNSQDASRISQQRQDRFRATYSENQNEETQNSMISEQKRDWDSRVEKGSVFDKNLRQQQLQEDEQTINSLVNARTQDKVKLIRKEKEDQERKIFSTYSNIQDIQNIVNQESVKQLEKKFKREVETLQKQIKLEEERQLQQDRVLMEKMERLDQQKNLKSEMESQMATLQQKKQQRSQSKNKKEEGQSKGSEKKDRSQDRKKRRDMNMTNNNYSEKPEKSQSRSQMDNRIDASQGGQGGQSTQLAPIDGDQWKNTMALMAYQNQRVQIEQPPLLLQDNRILADLSQINKLEGTVDESVNDIDLFPSKDKDQSQSILKRQNYNPYDDREKQENITQILQEYKETRFEEDNQIDFKYLDKISQRMDDIKSKTANFQTKLSENNNTGQFMFTGNLLARASAKIISQNNDQITDLIIDDLLFETVDILQEDERKKKQRALLVTKQLVFQDYLQELQILTQEMDDIGQRIDNQEDKLVTLHPVSKVEYQYLKPSDLRDDKQKIDLPTATLCNVLEKRAEFVEAEKQKSINSRQNLQQFNQITYMLMEEILEASVLELDNLQSDFTNRIFENQFK